MTARSASPFSIASSSARCRPGLGNRESEPGVVGGPSLPIDFRFPISDFRPREAAGRLYTKDTWAGHGVPIAALHRSPRRNVFDARSLFPSRLPAPPDRPVERQRHPLPARADSRFSNSAWEQARFWLWPSSWSCYFVDRRRAGRSRRPAPRSPLPPQL
jgi:hypothetical protein